MAFRGVTSLVVRHAGCNYLFDAGEGTQVALKKAKPGLKALRLIAVTHLHADHCLGIPGLLMLRAQMDAPGPLTIVGPPGIANFIHAVRQTIEFYINFEIQFIEWAPGATDLAYQDEHIDLSWAPLEHSIVCLGYRFTEHQRPGKFQPENARALNIPEGPLWSTLQQNAPIQLADGTSITPEQVLGLPRRGRIVSFVVDTRPTETIQTLCVNSDIAFIEGMFLNKLAPEAREKGHLTASEAARLTKQANVRRTVLVHFSPRYRNTELEALLTEARLENEQVEVGQELGKYEVPLPD